MRPADIYALPAARPLDGYDARRLADRLFLGHWLPPEDDSAEGDEDPAPLDPAGPLWMERKLERRGPTRGLTDAIVTFDVATWHGRPFAIVVGHGRYEQEGLHRIVTDAGAYDAALAHHVPDSPLAGFTRPEAIHDAASDVPELSGAGGTLVLRGPDDALRLVPEGHADAEGRIVFDEVAFRSLVARDVAPLIASIEARIAPRRIGFPLKLESVEKAVRTCFEAAIPIGVAMAPAYAPYHYSAAHRVGIYRDWAMAGTPSGTFLLGPSRLAYETFGTEFARHFACGQVGPMTEYAARVHPSPAERPAAIGAA